MCYCNVVLVFSQPLVPACQHLLMVWCLLVMTQLKEKLLLMSVSLDFSWLEQQPESVSLMEHGVVLLLCARKLSVRGYPVV